MKQVLFLMFSSLLMTNVAISQATESSFCEVPPKGSYINLCSNVTITKSENIHGVSMCTLTADCKTPPHSVQKTIPTTLTMYEYSFGPNSECQDIAAVNGHLTCIAEGDSFEGNYSSPLAPSYPTLER